MTETKEDDKNVVSLMANDVEVEVIPPGMCNDSSKKYFYSVADGWKYLATVNPCDTFMYCNLNCKVCSPDAKFFYPCGK